MSEREKVREVKIADGCRVRFRPGEPDVIEFTGGMGPRAAQWLPLVSAPGWVAALRDLLNGPVEVEAADV